MTKLLILSDSHNSTGAVERILHAESDATAVIFLGDGLRDLEEALTLYPKMKVYAVARPSSGSSAPKSQFPATA